MRISVPMRIIPMMRHARLIFESEQVDSVARVGEDDLRSVFRASAFVRVDRIGSDQMGEKREEGRRQRERGRRSRKRGKREA